MARTNGKTRGIFERPKGSEVWWVRWTCHYGHDHRQKIGPKSLAKEEYQDRRVAVRTKDYCLTRAQAARRENQPTLFADATSRYLTWAQREYPRSYSFREKALKHLVAAFGSRTLPEITTAGVEQYQVARRDAGAAPGTVNRERSVLSHLFRKAGSWGLVTHNPVVGTNKLQEPEGKPRPLTPDEEARLFMVLPEHYKAVVTLGLHTGLRLGELRAQRWADVDLVARTMRITRPKSGKPESLPLNQTARATLAELERTDPLVFPKLPKKLSDLFIRYVRKAELSDVTFHCLRDTFISRLAPHVTTPTLMTLARHRDYRTTRRYVRVDGAHLRAAVECLIPGPTGTPTGTGDPVLSQVADLLG
jgi:integrase